MLAHYFRFSGFGDDIVDDDQYDYGNEEYTDTADTTASSKDEETDDNNIYKDMKRAR